MRKYISLLFFSLFVFFQTFPAIAESPLDYTKQGLEFYEQGKMEDALNSFTKAIELKQHLASSYYNRGRTLSNMKQFVRALEDFNRAIEINPKVATYYNSRGIASLLSGKGQKIAQDDFNRAIELDPKYGAAIFNRAFTYPDELIEKQIDDLNTACKMKEEGACEALSEVLREKR